MINHIIKICGVTNPDMAEKAASAGAHFIGIVFHPASARYVSINQAITISHAARKGGALPVAVFVNQTAAEMQNICEQSNIDIVQLHGETARLNHHLLPPEYQRIYVKNISANGRLQIDTGLSHLRTERDMILIDHETPGQGNSINLEGFHYDLPFPWLLAGGLTSSNVAKTILDLQPDGVDVSTGVESSLGNKDIHLIQSFITAARGHHHATIK
jgi:phosphoribosylanthranilate isomerase